MRLLAAVLLALAVAPSALAAASLTVTSPNTASFAVTLNGVDQTPTFSLAMTIGYTGGGNTAGWNVTAAATQFTSGANTLPAGATSVTNGVDDATCAGSQCANPTNSITWPVQLSATPAPIYNAAASTGRGTNVITMTFAVAVPANVLAGTYTSTVTLTAAQGP